jgi:hypothetical protein
MSKWKRILKRATGGPPSIHRNWNRLKQPIIAMLDLVLEDKNSFYNYKGPGQRSISEMGLGDKKYSEFYVGDYYAPKFEKINRDLKSQEDAMDIIGTIQELGELLEEEPKGEIEDVGGLQMLKKLVDRFLRIGAPKNME